MEIEKIVKLVKDQLEQYNKKDQLEQCDEKKIPIEASGRHIHLSYEDIENLFGKGYDLKQKKELSQPGQFACEERVRIIGPKGVIENVIILGPARAKSQVEISLTDCRKLGIKPFIKNSGDILGTAGIIVTNKDKTIILNQGAIIAKNHIHMNSEEARRLDVRDKQKVKVKIHSERPIIFEEVLIRVNDSFRLSMHIDYDEANACSLNKNSYGKIV
ncbi:MULTISPECIES: phosphate propanoyltransferase [Psychrilyobacter]|uniref:Phosphate propanoyltransferase n=1 Tax=Psychrilyobacter piezotolerans TaxID=2293438 RepID=A0ABX9KGJ0_9FUSO|nr:MULTISPECIES: phosphate propanoyltransferase [Psychrilyobacter]MCS5422392.1 phosphate propanoyltransferase [Psychrilyobacter sp. S5]NDI78408.1 phosphate propanoyltransferase [Psychrilyobacter piezotolerans]RDE61133.1 phosphate propanoyltransferase [Psychrilyobacter sp. S5]REI40774.1 phosphate propanoyltransferase [Psychrilyobacter piezotolerans]